MIQSKAPININLKLNATKVNITIEENATYLRHGNDVYLSSFVNNEDGEFTLDFKYKDDLLHVQDNMGKSLLPEDFKINKEELKEVTLDQAYKVCKFTGRGEAYFFKK